jgi:uncharacterized membrane protein
VSSPEKPKGFAPVLERNITALISRRQAMEKHSSLEERIAAAIGRFTGSMLFVYLHVIFFGLWIVINLGWTPLPRFDESFVILAMVASVEAIFLSTFVLIAQNRIATEEDKRAELALQISLLAEHEVTSLLKLMSAIAAKLGVKASEDPELEPLKEDVAPEQVLDQIDAMQEERKRKTPH